MHLGGSSEPQSSFQRHALTFDLASRLALPDPRFTPGHRANHYPAMEEFFDNPLEPKHGLTLTPFHLFTLFLSALSLLLTNAPSPIFRPYAPPLTRLTILLVLLLLGHHAILHLVSTHHKSLEKAHVEEKARHDPLVKSELKKLPNDWENESAHPSHFLTTRDGKPRLFPFPLGLAGGKGGGKELWWEAGNSSHVGHYNQRETPAARAQLKAQVQLQENARQKKAKKAIKAYTATRHKWMTRLTHLKVLLSIVCVALASRKAAVGCLAAWIYYIVFQQLAVMLAIKKDDDEKPAKERNKVPQTPGMAMTYLYEPNGDDLVPAGNIPTRAPSNRLMTSFNSHYAS